MMIDKKWFENVQENLSEKSVELKQIILASKLNKELETKTLEQVLVEYLPASDATQLHTAAEDMYNAIDEMYDSLDDQITDAQVEARLNTALYGLSCNEQGKWLVNLLHCTATVLPKDTDEDSVLEELMDQDCFQQQDISNLMDMVLKRIDLCAGLITRQEFMVMEHSLEDLPCAVVEAQMNSGSRYAQAYAAAMYIYNKQVNTHQDLTASQLGLLAVQSVESSHLLAQYHYGKLRMQELMAKLKFLAKHLLVKASAILLQASALGIRVVGSYWLGVAVWDGLTYLAVSNPVFLFAVAFAVAAVAFLAFTQEEAVSTVVDICECVKGFVTKIINYFKTSNTVTDPVGHASSTQVPEYSAVHA